MLPALDFGAFNWLAMVAAILVSMALGFLVYHRAVMGARWMAWVGLRGDPPQDAAMRAVAVALVMATIAVFMTAMLVQWTGAATFAEGAFVGVVIGIVAATVAVVHPTFEMRPAGVGMLYAAHHIVEFALVGAILAGWR